MISVGYYQITDLSAAVPIHIATGSVSDATNAAPIVITSSSHGLDTGDLVIIEGVAGNTAANGVWSITKVDANKFSLDGSVGNAAYTSGGAWYQQPHNSHWAMIQAEDKAVRWRDDGTAPTASVGMVLAAGESLLYPAMSIRSLRVIEVEGSAKLSVTFYAKP